MNKLKEALLSAKDGDSSLLDTYIIACFELRQNILTDVEELLKEQRLYCADKARVIEHNYPTTQDGEDFTATSYSVDKDSIINATLL